jgi:hypothetical protein
MRERFLRWLRWLGNGPQEDAALLELLRESEVRMDERIKALQEWIVCFDRDSEARMALEAEQRAVLVKNITANNETVDRDLTEHARALSEIERTLDIDRDDSVWSLIDRNQKNREEATARLTQSLSQVIGDIQDFNKRLIALETAPRSAPPPAIEEEFDPGRGWSRQKQLAEEGELQRA